MSRTNLQKIESMARRAYNPEQEGNFPDPEINFSDYAQGAALGANEDDFARTTVAFMDLAEAGRIPVEVVEIAHLVRSISTRKTFS